VNKNVAKCLPIKTLKPGYVNKISEGLLSPVVGNFSIASKTFACDYLEIFDEKFSIALRQSKQSFPEKNSYESKLIGYKLDEILAKSDCPEIAKNISEQHKGKDGKPLVVAADAVKKNSELFLSAKQRRMDPYRNMKTFLALLAVVVVVALLAWGV
jgi:hypothetical protein